MIKTPAKYMAEYHPQKLYWQVVSLRSQHYYVALFQQTKATDKLH